MSHEIINTVEALITRLEESAANNEFNVITDPTSAEVIENGSLPHVRLLPTRIGSMEDVALNARGQVPITFLLRLREDPTYGLFNASKTRGLFWLLEKVANCLDSDDMSAGGAWGNAPRWEVVDYAANETVLQCDINVQLISARFTRGKI